MPDDAFLVASMLGGDEAALRKLMDRYDRLVRYTIFRTARDWCARDPYWLDSIASETWTGFVQSLRRHPEKTPKSVKAYLSTTARNIAISALRRQITIKDVGAGDVDAESIEIQLTHNEPGGEMERLETLDALRACIEALDPEGRRMAAQLALITERRWREAATILGVKESTLRSRWRQTVAILRQCIERKTGGPFAPGDLADDY